VVFPSQQFTAEKTVAAVAAERCTLLFGVPTMFIAELDALAKKPPMRELHVRAALTAGSPLPSRLVKRLESEMGIQAVVNAYGMTETSPMTIYTSVSDPGERRPGTVGKVGPHIGAKIVDASGDIVPRGVAGEICTSGYALQIGYLKDPAKTEEAMQTDADGTVWMHTGDEGVVDEDGYFRITGRTKDLIIRGELVSLSPSYDS